MLVLPYTQASQSGVGLLAIAAGLPVVVSDLGGLPELAYEPSFVAEAGGPDTLAETIRRHIDDGADVRREVLRHARERFSWSTPRSSPGSSTTTSTAAHDLTRTTPLVRRSLTFVTLRRPNPNTGLQLDAPHGVRVRVHHDDTVRELAPVDASPRDAVSAERPAERSRSPVLRPPELVHVVRRGEEMVAAARDQEHRREPVPGSAPGPRDGMVNAIRPCLSDQRAWLSFAIHWPVAIESRPPPPLVKDSSMAPSSGPFHFCHRPA